jgi:hypothetical protein
MVPAQNHSFTFELQIALKFCCGSVSEVIKARESRSKGQFSYQDFFNHKPITLHIIYTSSNK